MKVSLNMAYDKSYLEKISLKLIEKHNIMFFSHLVSFLPCSSSTFYSLKLEKSETIKKAIELNKVNAKTQLLSNWINRDASPSLQIAAMKLLGTKEEVDRLNNKSFNILEKEDKIELKISDEAKRKIDEILDSEY